MRSLLVNHILPYFKNIILDKINRRIIEDWLLKLREKPGRYGKLSAVTINNAIRCLNIMFNRALEMEYIHRNTLKGMVKLAEESKERGVLTIDEIRKLFADNSLENIWNGNLKCFTATMLPLTTGMRQGEVLGLQIQNVFKDHVAVLWNWSKRYGFREPKGNSKRLIPVPKKTSFYLNKLISNSEYQDPEDLVFYGKTRNEPINDKALLRAFYGALARIGIDEEKRRERKLVYHGLRHTFNSIMRGKIADSKLQRLTGHRTIRMIDHYTHWSLSDFKDVLDVQNEYFS